MNNTYGEFQGTELDPALDFDYGQRYGKEQAVKVLVLLGRRKKPTVREQAEQLLENATKESKKRAKAVTKTASKTVEDAKLGDALEEALGRARKAGADADLVGLLEQARTKVGKAVDKANIADAVNGAGKSAAAVATTTGLSTILGEAIDKAREAANRLDVSDLQDTARDTAHEARKRAAKAIGNGHLPEVDADKARNFLDDLKEKLVDAIETVRTDVAPKAADALVNDMLPAMQETAQTVARRVQDDMVPAAQELAEEEVMPRARKAASIASERAGTLSEMLRVVAMAIIERMVEDILPGARKAGTRAMRTAREDVFPAASETAGEAAHKVSDAAAQTPDLLSDMLDMAREKVADAMDRAEPKMSGAAHSAKKAADSGRHGVTGAVSSAGRGVKRGVGGAVGATTHATREFTSILFWLGMLGGLVLLVFVPDREKQEEVWNNIRQFLGEVREMWRDLQGPAPEFDETTSV